MPAASWRIRVGADETEATWDPAEKGASGPVFICAHGAGGHMGDRATVAVAQAIREQGIGTVRFNFLYRSKHSARPDPMPRLIECFEAVIEKVRAEVNPATLILGGRSMGGRAASMLLGQKTSGRIAQGLLLLAYPLHPPGQTHKMRDAHLPSITVPVLCVNGTRDPFCDPPLMKDVLSRLGANWQMLWLEGADHSFHVLKRSGRTDSDVLQQVAGEVRAWVDRVPLE